jgi:hypothetical protein
MAGAAVRVPKYSLTDVPQPSDETALTRVRRANSASPPMSAMVNGVTQDCMGEAEDAL